MMSLAGRSLLVLLVLCAGAAGAGEILVVGHKRGDSVGFYDAGSGKELASVAVGSKPHEMVVSANRRFLYVTNYGVDSYTDTTPGGNTITIIDLPSQGRAGEIVLGRFRRPHGIERGNSGLLYVTVDQPPALLVIDPGEQGLLRHYAIGQSGPHMLAVTSDERKVYVANSGSGTVTALTFAPEPAARHIAVGGVPMGLALSADEKLLFASTRTANSVAVIDTRKDEVTRTIEIPGQPVRLRLTPDGRRLLVSLTEAGDVAVVDTASFRVVRRFHAGARVEGITTDRAGRFGYVSAQEDNHVIKFSLRNWKPVKEIKTGARPDPLVILR